MEFTGEQVHVAVSSGKLFCNACKEELNVKKYHEESCTFDKTLGQQGQASNQGEARTNIAKVLLKHNNYF